MVYPVDHPPLLTVVDTVLLNESAAARLTTEKVKRSQSVPAEAALNRPEFAA